MNHPDAHSGPQPASRTRARYRMPSRAAQVGGRVALAVVAAAASAWLLWAALAAANPDTRSQILDFRVLDDHRVEAAVELVTDPGSTIDCTLRAQDADHVVTGIARIVSPPSSAESRVVRTIIKTRDRAVVVTVAGCRRRGS